MTGYSARQPRASLPPLARRGIATAIVVLVLVVMFFGTKIVPKGSTLGQGPAAFNAATYGAKQFPIQRKFIVSKAVDAATLAAAIDKDQAAAAKQYGIAQEGGVGAEIPVKLTGVVGKVPAAGFTPVKVTGLPAGYSVNVQLGPAITGTDLRDATGKIQLGNFENQIQFQNAGTAINDQLKKVLTKAGAPNLTGKTITVEGVFLLINPKAWNVTPATLAVQ